MTWLIVGLGNPGPDYRDTYHNVGFRVIEVLAKRWDVSLSVRVGDCLVGCPEQGDRFANRVLVEPMTFMNNSGSALGSLFGRFGPEARLLVVSDDVWLPLGRIRIRERGSAGGHNGLKSIGSALGSDEYIRVRVGILPDGSRPVADGSAERIGDMRDYVLSRVRKAHREMLAETEGLAADAVEEILATGAYEAMSKYNGVDLRQV